MTDSFSDDRIIVVRPGDPRLGFLWADDQAGQEQWHEGPTYAVVGARAPDDKLQRLAAKIHVEFAELRQFRDTKPN